MKRVAVTYPSQRLFRLDLSPEADISGQHFVSADEYNELQRLQAEYETFQVRLGDLAGQRELESFETGGKKYLIQHVSSELKHYYPVDEFGQVSSQFYREVPSR